MSAPSPRSDTTVPVVQAAVHGLLWILLALFLMVVVSGYDKAFRDFNLKVPPLTRGVLLVARWFGNYWYVLVLAGPFLLAGDAAVLFLLRQRPSTRVLGWLWFLAMLLLPLVVLVASWLAVHLLWMKLVEGLAR